MQGICIWRSRHVGHENFTPYKLPQTELLHFCIRFAYEPAMWYNPVQRSIWQQNGNFECNVFTLTDSSAFQGEMLPGMLLIGLLGALLAPTYVSAGMHSSQTVSTF